MKKGQLGFTLIELMVVISIIAMMASIILVSLKTARDKAVNGKIKETVSQMRSHAEIYRSNNGVNGYSNMCNLTNPQTDTYKVYNAALTAYSPTAVDTVDGGCVVGATYFVVGVKLKVPEGGKNFWCIDHLNNARTVGPYTDFNALFLDLPNPIQCHS